MMLRHSSVTMLGSMYRMTVENECLADFLLHTSHKTWSKPPKILYEHLVRMNKGGE